MKTLIRTLLLVIALAAPLHAQAQASPASRLGWDQGAANLAEANTFGATLFIDNVGGADTGGVVLVGKSCSGTASPFACVADLPALTVGPHVLRLSATFSTFESPVSTPLDIVMIVIQTPTNLRIVSVTIGGTPVP